MPYRKFRVNIFEVETEQRLNAIETPFTDAVIAAHQAPFTGQQTLILNRNRLLQERDYQQDCYLFNFITSQFEGPGRIAPAQPSTAMGLQPQENFAHQTAALYDPALELILIESSTIGMRAGALARYFKEFARPGNEYLLTPRLDEDATERALRYQTIRYVEVETSSAPIRNPELANDLGVVKTLADGIGGSKVRVKISVDGPRHRTLGVAGVRDLVRRILGRYQDERVSKLILYGRSHDDEAMDPIDLIQHTEKYDRELLIDDNLRTINHATRWQAMLDIRNDLAA